MKFGPILGATAGAIALATITPISQTLWPSVVALADSIYTYGIDGRSGQDGRSGESGRDASPRTLQVDGPQQVNAIGSDGYDGEDGRAGGSPSCRAQPRNVHYDLKAANGGDGGDGGRGGRGGNGGDVTLYHTDVTDLRQVLVNAGGGRPGRGGRGGPGASGCRCQDRSWRVEICRDGTCQTERFVCQDGRSGRHGQNGWDGAVGEPGQLWLVNQTERLLPETPIQTQSLETFLQQPVQLSNNVWQSRSGAAALLAVGSVVSDTYSQYVGRVEAEAAIVWQAPRSQTAFLAVSPTATLDDSGELHLGFPESVWVDGNTEQSGELTTFTIAQIARADKVTDLSWGNQQGQGKALALTVIDLGRESEYVDTRFELAYRTTTGDPRDDRRVRYQDRFVGQLPNEVVVRDNNRFLLALGQLPIRDRDLQPGTYVEMELRITRSLGDQSATRTLDWKGQL